ncbi:MAG: sugar phosphate isomerase/epimerase family protein [Eubacteriales bacterium]
MKKSLNAWTVDGSLDFEGTFAAVSKAGFDGIELNIDSSGAHSITLSTTKDEFAAVRALSEKYSLPVVSISTSLWGEKMGHPDKWDEARALLRKQLEAASELGAGGILTVPGGMGGEYTLDRVRRNSIEFLKSMKSEIEKSGIFVGVENVWNGFFLSPYDMASFVDEIGSPKIGAYLDAGNMLAFSVSEYWVEVLGSRIGFVHVKDYKRAGGLNSGGTWEDITHGSANWSEIIPALRKAGFDGYLTGEVFKADAGMTFEEYYKKVAGEIEEIIKYTKEKNL